MSQRAELGSCYRFSSAVGSLCASRSSCQNITCSGPEIRFLSVIKYFYLFDKVINLIVCYYFQCADQRCARAVCPFSETRTSISQYSLNEICFVGGEMAACDVGFACNSIGACVSSLSVINNNTLTTASTTTNRINSSITDATNINTIKSTLSSQVPITTTAVSGSNSIGDGEFRFQKFKNYFNCFC